MTRTTSKQEVTVDVELKVNVKDLNVKAKSTADFFSKKATAEGEIKRTTGPLSLAGNVKKSTDGTTSLKVEGTVGTDDAKAKANVTLNTNQGGTNLQVQVGTDEKIGRTTFKQSAGVQVNF